MFLDVLGAKEESERSPADYLVRLDAAVRRGLDRGFMRALDTAELPVPRIPTFTWFSDNLAAAWPIRSPWNPEMAISGLEVAAAHVQLALADHGLFVRGGIAVGPHFMDKEIVFGPALIEAVKLEEDAIYPRIVLSHEVAAQEHQHMATYYGGSPLAPQNSLLLMDTDGVVFVNYLYLLLDDFNNPSNRAYAETRFARHRDTVQRALTTHKATPRIADKYRWLASHHNHCVRIAGLNPALLIPDAMRGTQIREFTSYRAGPGRG